MRRHWRWWPHPLGCHRIWFRPDKASLFWDVIGATAEARAEFRLAGDIVLPIWPFVIFYQRSVTPRRVCDLPAGSVSERLRGLIRGLPRRSPRQ